MHTPSCPSQSLDAEAPHSRSRGADPVLAQATQDGSPAPSALKLNDFKQIVADAYTQRTSVVGIWAAGDVTDVKYHQNNISAGDAVKALEEANANVKGMVAIFSYGFGIADENFKNSKNTKIMISNRIIYSKKSNPYHGQ